MTEARSHKVFVTGASGFLGSHVTRALIERGIPTAILSRSGVTPPRLTDCANQITIITGDLREPELFRATLKAFAPTAILHLGWQGVEGAARNDAAQMENVSTSLALAILAQQCGARIFIGAGSQAEYGPANRLCDEGAPENPTTLYGKAKVETARQLASYCAANDMRFAWLRIFSTYGPGDHGHWLIPYVLRELCAGRAPELTKCEQKWDFLYATDAAAAFLAVLETSSASGIFNLGSGDAPTLHDTIEQLRDMIDPALPLGFGKRAYGPDQVMHLQADITKLTNITGWRPIVTLADGLQKTLEAYRAAQ